jgi:hypothetical protein
MATTKKAAPKKATAKKSAPRTPRSPGPSAPSVRVRELRAAARRYAVSFNPNEVIHFMNDYADHIESTEGGK